MNSKGEKNMAIDNYELRQTSYANAVSVKYDNRRLTLINRGEEGFGIEIRKFSADPTPVAMTKHIKGKMHLTMFNMTQESAELLMLMLAEQLGYAIVEDSVHNLKRV